MNHANNLYQMSQKIETPWEDVRMNHEMNDMNRALSNEQENTVHEFLKRVVT